MTRTSFLAPWNINNQLLYHPNIKCVLVALKKTFHNNVSKRMQTWYLCALHSCKATFPKWLGKCTYLRKEIKWTLAPRDLAGWEKHDSQLFLFYKLWLRIKTESIYEIFKTEFYLWGMGFRSLPNITVSIRELLSKLPWTSVSFSVCFQEKNCRFW